MKKVWIAIVVVVVVIAAYWWWSSRGNISPAISQVNPNGQDVVKHTDEAQVLQGLKGANVGDIDHELQDINLGQ